MQSFLCAFWNSSGVLHYDILEYDQALTSGANLRQMTQDVDQFSWNQIYTRWADE